MFATSSQGETLLVTSETFKCQLYSLHTCLCLLAESSIICHVCAAQTSWRPSAWTKPPVWLGWRVVTPSTAVWAPCAPCISWGSATSHSHTPATHPGKSQQHSRFTVCHQTQRDKYTLMWPYNSHTSIVQVCVHTWGDLYPWPSGGGSIQVLYLSTKSINTTV